MSSVPSWFASAACLAVGTYNWHPCQHAVCVVGQPMGHRTGAGRGGHTATHTGEEEWVYSPGPSRSVYVPSLGRVVLATDPMESYHPGSIE